MTAMRIVTFALGALVLAGCGGSDGDGAPRKGIARFRLAPVSRTDIVRKVEATGTVTPRNTDSGIPVGAQVNGRIIRLFVDYNSNVTNGQVVALIDPLVYDAAYKNAVGQLHSNRAKVKQGEATLALAEKTLVRKDALFAKQMCSEADYDAAVEARDTAIAALDAARAAVEQSEAQVSKARADLDYCTIRSPVNGVVIDRKVEEGETVVSSMNAVPILTVAEDLKTVWVKATIPEADVGNITIGQTVTFTADAYRRRFTGRVVQVRRAAETTNNVVTFPVIIEAENPDEMLFPGMTATLSIETARAEDVLAVAAAAFRFRPLPADLPPGELPKGRKLWFADAEGSLSPVTVETGVSDDSFIELVNAAALEGKSAVVGYATVAAASPVNGAPSEATNPFMPKMPKHGTKGTAPEPRK